MNKEVFIKEKLNNFIIFIESIIGKDNNIYKDFISYKNDIKLFLQAIMQISSFAVKEGNNKVLPKEHIFKYLEYQNITKKIEDKDIIKLNRYFNMFIKIIES